MWVARLTDGKTFSMTLRAPEITAALWASVGRPLAAEVCIRRIVHRRTAGGDERRAPAHPGHRLGLVAEEHCVAVESDAHFLRVGGRCAGALGVPARRGYAYGEKRSTASVMMPSIPKPKRRRASAGSFTV